MGLALIGLIVAGFGMLAVLRSAPAALMVLCSAGLLQAASAMAFGSANITPGHMSLIFFLMAMAIRPDALKFGVLSLYPIRPGLILAALSAWALASGYLMPRLFAGEFLVYPMNSIGWVVRARPLYPDGANFNQSIYFLSGLLIFLSVSSMVRSNSMMKRAGTAMLIAIAVNIGIVILDSATFAVGMSSLLDFIRNADYAQNYMHKFLGFKRITGSFPEASAFTTTTVGLFAFTFRLWRAGVYSQITGLLSLFTLFAIVFSFSSTGYVALIVYLSFSYASVMLGAERRGGVSVAAFANQSIFISMGPLLALAAAIALAINPSILTPITQTIDQSITAKLQTSSGIERSSWNMAGLGVFLETYGLGAGTGSVRTSSFVVGVLANLGIVGATLFAWFFWNLFFTRPERSAPMADQNARHYAAAARGGCFAILTASCISGASIDLGIHFYVMAGMAMPALFYRRPAGAPASRHAPPPDRTGVNAPPVPAS